jgi:hypothetical protein
LLNGIVPARRVKLAVPAPALVNVPAMLLLKALVPEELRQDSAAGLRDDVDPLGGTGGVVVPRRVDEAVALE